MTRSSVRSVATSTWIAALSFTLLSLSACEATGEVRISWSFSDGSIEGAGDCARRGVERVVITFRDAGGVALRRYQVPCGRAEIDLRNLPVGTYQVEVQAFGPSGLPFRDFFTGEVTLVETLTGLRVTDGGGPTESAVVFTPNPECSDGVDNDGDGLVDADDPGCLDKDGRYDPIPARTEEDGQGPGTLQVAWTLNGGRDTCAEVQPEGAAFAAVVVDNMDAAVFSCAQGSGAFFVAAGPHEVFLRLMDAEGQALAQTAAVDVTVVQDITSELAFDVGLDDFDPPQTGQLQIALFWIDTGMGCGDASPVVENQTLLLYDADQEIVEVVGLGGDPWDGTPGECLGPMEVQGPSAYLPAGEYSLTVTGIATTGGVCWGLPNAPLRVDLGPNPVIALVVPQTDATGLCSP